jgi:hypothetical protein
MLKVFNKYYEGENEGIEFCYWLVSLSLAVDILCCVSEAQMPVWLKNAEKRLYLSKNVAGNQAGSC